MCNTINNTKKTTSQDEHDKEHKTWSRRAFMQALGITGAGSMMLSSSMVSASASTPLAKAISSANTDRILVVIRLKGGNDGLNTIIPVYDYDTYANNRPTIKIDQNQILSLNNDFGVPNTMQGVKELWDDGKMKVVHGVGYENQSLSHFFGSDLWATTDIENATENSGWMGRYFEELYPDFLMSPPDEPAAIQIGNKGNLMFEGDGLNYSMAVANPETLYQIASQGQLYDLNNLDNNFYGDQAEFLRGVANTTLNYAEVINEAYQSSNDNSTNYTSGSLSNQLRLVSRLIKGNLGTKVYFVSLGGFDTHNGQIDRHPELMTELSDSLKAFYDDLSNNGWDDKVLSMTISEFGRRVAQNGSNGTDHGTASQMMLFGSGLNGNGFVSNHPDLGNLNNQGNLEYSIDFRQVYASVLIDWLCVDPTIVNTVLLNGNFTTLQLGMSCATLSTNEEIISNNSLSHFVSYNDNNVYLHYNLKYNMHVDIKLYSITGQMVANLKNEFSFQGKHIINVTEIVGNQASGSFIYRIATRNGFYSKLLVLQ